MCEAWVKSLVLHKKVKQGTLMAAGSKEVNLMPFLLIALRADDWYSYNISLYIVLLLSKLDFALNGSHITSSILHCCGFKIRYRVNFDRQNSNRFYHEVGYIFSLNLKHSMCYV